MEVQEEVEKSSEKKWEEKEKGSIFEIWRRRLRWSWWCRIKAAPTK